MNSISNSFVNATGTFMDFSPGWNRLFRPKLIRKLIPCIGIIKKAVDVFLGKTDIENCLGNMIGNAVISRSTNKLTWEIIRAHHIVRTRKGKPLFKVNGVGGKTWFNFAADISYDQRAVMPVTLVYHHANKAGKHIDIHIGRWSFILRVSNKPVEKKITFNNKGELTQASKDALINHLKEHIANNSRFAQNLDHSITNAKLSWKLNDPDWTNGYGSGPTRQVIAESQAEFYHPDLTSSLHLYCPLFNKHQGTYMYRIYSGKDTGTPIIIWGNLIPRDKKFHDRLHLTMIAPEELDKFKSKTDALTTTKKEDGASCYFNSSPLGGKFWSPRESKTTGHRIEYTWKVPELAMLINNQHSAEGMGELLFYKKVFGIIPRTLSAAEIGGVLNSSEVRPRNIYPLLKLYRIDKWDGRDTYDLDFFSNRLLQLQLKAEVDCKYLGVVILMPPIKILDWEGLVAVPPGKSVNDGFKLKWRGDLNDWRIDKIDFYLSEKQNMAGIITCTSLESGKQFNLGPGQVGDADRCLSMIESPNDWLGTIVKVSGFNGHEGRAAKIREIHVDK